MSTDSLDYLISSSASDTSEGATATSAPTSAELADAATPVEPDAPRDEIERLEPDVTGPLTLVSGQVVDVVPMKLRETMKLLKIVTRGASGVLESTMAELDLNDPVRFAQVFGALILFAIPEAENEAVEFIQSMVLPHDFDKLAQQDKIDGLNKLAVDLANPELDDVVTIVERVVRRESEDIRNLGKRISTAFQLASRAGVLPEAS